MYNNIEYRDKATDDITAHKHWNLAKHRNRNETRFFLFFEEKFTHLK